MAVGVESGPTRAPCELMKLAGAKHPHTCAVELRKRAKQDSTDRDVDADTKRVGAADDRQKTLAGKPLDESPVAGEHARVVHTDAVAEVAGE